MTRQLYLCIGHKKDVRKLLSSDVDINEGSQYAYNILECTKGSTEMQEEMSRIEVELVGNEILNLAMRFRHEAAPPAGKSFTLWSRTRRSARDEGEEDSGAAGCA